MHLAANEAEGLYGADLDLVLARGWGSIGPSKIGARRDCWRLDKRCRGTRRSLS